MRVFVVDTDVASFIFKKDTRAAFYKQYVNDDSLSVISFQTLAELEQWALNRDWGEERRNELADFIDKGFVVTDSNDVLCKMWAQVRDSSRRVGRLIEIADAWIAATALFHGADLITHNASHFDFIPGLTVITER